MKGTPAFLQKEGKTLENVTNFEAFQRGNTFHISGKCLNIRVNIPTLHSVSFRNPLVGSPVFPALNGFNLDESLCRWEWFRILPSGFKDPQPVLVSSSNNYVPTEEDLNCSLMCVCTPCNKEESGYPFTFNLSKCNPNFNMKSLNTQVQKLTERSGKITNLMVGGAEFKGFPLATSFSQLCSVLNSAYSTKLIPALHISYLPTGAKTPKSIFSESEYLEYLQLDPIPTLVVNDIATVVSEAQMHPALSKNQLIFKKSEGAPIRLLSYNILLDAFCDSHWALNHLYPYLNTRYSRIDYRSQLAATEIIGWNPDMICLQEVSEHVHQYLMHRLGMEGMDGFYANKISEQPFGSSIFWNTNRFELKRKWILDLTKEWYDLPNADALCKADPTFAKKMEQTTTTSQVVLLCDRTRNQVQSKPPNPPAGEFILVNIHLFSNPHAPHIRILQVATILQKIEQQYPKHPVFITGDFNADDHSGCTEYIRSFVVREDNYEWAEGSVFGDIRSESQEEREGNWHKVMLREHEIRVRNMFSLMDSKETGTGLLELSNIQSLISGLNLSPFSQKCWDRNHFCYAQFYQAFASMRLHSTEDFDLVIKTLETKFGSTPEDVERTPKVHIGCCDYPRTTLKHSFNVSPVYKGEQITYFAGLNPKPESLDHMFYPVDYFQLSGKSPAIPEEVLKENTALPSIYFPSDHTALIADFTWKI
eukprot:TRINITY_DN5882_c0_g1_i1.p1 TRINITY_DN5882_c0_g1~~TRINITY_DN5882_c0_g1_i1.p1  ORF type:complete len:781 (-),score=134.25 TRINITY_DN5882_c0_g1_i1:21-2132(-)